LTVKPISSNSAYVRVHSHELDMANETYITSTALLIKEAGTSYKSFLESFITQNKQALLELIDIVAEKDVLSTCARNAKEFNHHRPTLIKNASGSVKVNALRHPILEHIMRNEYVPNDVDIDANGLLLFGMNASGKSSLMKSIGLNVIMAQSGMFVAADSMVLSPYSHIFTRIVGNDNIYRGWSSFTVEMLELRNILQRCNQNSLVLGDELCSGTEATSALSIVAAGIQYMINRQCSFVFATHLHELSEMDRIKNTKSVLLKHMHVEIDKSSGKILYDRKLKEGPGSSVYGLEVCKGLGLPSEFIKSAHEVRCELQGISKDFVNTKKSRYNSQVFMDSCGVCGSRSKQLETHHIVPQNIRKNNKVSNLMPLCESCHDKIHHPKIF
jgi:DNA mismatch repair protein MutS